MTSTKILEIEEHLNGDNGSKIMTAMIFSTMVSQIVWDSDDELDYIDAVIQVAEDTGVDPEAAKDLLTPPVLSLVKIAFEKRRLVTRSTHLSEDW